MLLDVLLGQIKFVTQIKFLKTRFIFYHFNFIKAGYLKSAITSIRSLIYSRGIIVPVAIKKQIYTHVGPHMEMSWVSYLASDTIYEVIADRSLKVTPRYIFVK